jgi:hypothetical protein
MQSIWTAASDRDLNPIDERNEESQVPVSALAGNAATDARFIGAYSSAAQKSETTGAPDCEPLEESEESYQASEYLIGKQNNWRDCGGYECPF